MSNKRKNTHIQRGILVLDVLEKARNFFRTLGDGDVCAEASKLMNCDLV